MMPGVPAPGLLLIALFTLFLALPTATLSFITTSTARLELRQLSSSPSTCSSRKPSLSSSSSASCRVRLHMAGYDEMNTALSQDISSSLGIAYDASFRGGSGGSGWASVGPVEDKNGKGPKLFCKTTGMSGASMLNAEFQGVKAMHETQTVKVPGPVAAGQVGDRAYVVFEYLDMGGGRGQDAARRFGRELAQMHKCTSKEGKYGFHVDNTCGATPQPNKWTDSWADFWDEHRLGHMLKLCRRNGASLPREAELRAKVKALLSEHEKEHDLAPALCHGDLWTGNAAYTKDGDPVIFDPATYYGDREVDLAMSTLFGSFDRSFYEAYEEEFPLPPGHKERVTIYNLYHILNHYVLFGGGYWSSAAAMADRIMAM